jgi:hypothetical protein
MSDVMIEIEDMLIDGYTIDEVKNTLCVPREWIVEVQEFMATAVNETRFLPENEAIANGLNIQTDIE